eukprot:GHVL01040386.1.p1 GENE.GHVL01040386.1~~GHVL01040386.1.p1  ORF type:complete len:163 (-),score=31.08 GHVL01040386.1:104-592(-)
MLHERCKQNGFDKWNMEVFDDFYWNIFKKEEIVCLTPDAEEDLDTFDNDKVYVIGGLVDRTIMKCETMEQANQVGEIVLRKLPFKKYVPVHQSTVLNINTVVEVMVAWLQTKDWVASLTKCIPQRKQSTMGRKGMLKNRRNLRREAREKESQDANEDLTINS